MVIDDLDAIEILKVVPSEGGFDGWVSDDVEVKLEIGGHQLMLTPEPGIARVLQIHRGGMPLHIVP